MPRFYRKVLNKTLEEAVVAQLELESSEQFNVLEELALMRERCSNFVALYSKAHEADELLNNDETKEMKIAAGDLMKEALKDVADLADKASKIHYSSKNLFTALDLKLVVNQLTRIMYQVAGSTHQNLAKEFEHAINLQLVLPSEDSGTTLTPDQDVTAMDETVPKEV